MSRRWTGRGGGLAIGCLVSAIVLLGSSAPRAFADASPINAVTTTVDTTADDAIVAVDDTVTSDIADAAQETSVGASIEPTTDHAAETPDTTSVDTSATGTTVAATDVVSEAAGTDVVPDGTSEASGGGTDTDAPQEAPQTVEVTPADVISAGATTDEDAAPDAIAATLDSATETTHDRIDVGSGAVADVTDTISDEGTTDEQSSPVAIVAASETTSDVVAMIAGTSTDEPDVVATEATEVAAAIGDATVAAVSMADNPATVVDTATGSAADLTPEISSDITTLCDAASDAAVAVVETVSDTAGMMTDVTAETMMITQATAQTVVREASATIVEPSAAIVEEAVDATVDLEGSSEISSDVGSMISLATTASSTITDAIWATFETVTTESSSLDSNVEPLETVADTTAIAADPPTSAFAVTTEVIAGVEEVLVFADLAAQTLVDSTTATVDTTTDITAPIGETATEASVTLSGTTVDKLSETTERTIEPVTEVFGEGDQVVGLASEITSDTVGTGPAGISDAATTLSEAASAVVAAIGGDGALADPTAVLNAATETVASDLVPASLGSTDEASEGAISGPMTLGRSIQGGRSPMRNERLLLSVNRSQTEGERFQGTEPVAPCGDASSLDCALTGGADGIDSLVESVASIIRILALTGLTFLPWVAAAGMLAFLGGLALAASRRRRAAGSLPEAALPRGSHVKDAWAYS